MMTKGNHFRPIQPIKMNGPAASVLPHSYEVGRPPAVPASGNEDVARSLLEHAKENELAIQRDSTLVANLLDVERPDGVPPQLYAVMAEIFFLLEKADQKY